MTDNNEADLISSLYPPPPPYYKFFTDENVNRFKKWKEEQGEKDTSMSAEGDISDKTEKPDGELKFHIPPERPSGTHYRGYGNLWSFEDKLPSLKDSGWKQLYEENDEEISSSQKSKELHKLIESLLLNFLELLGIVSTDPQHFHVKIEDLKLILININHLLNTYRPHQSRESLIMLLRKQIEEKKNEIATIDNVSKDIKNKISSLFNDVSTDIEPIISESKVNEENTQVTKNEIIEEILSKEL